LRISAAVSKAVHFRHANVEEDDRKIALENPPESLFPQLTGTTSRSGPLRKLLHREQAVRLSSTTSTFALGDVDIAPPLQSANRPSAATELLHVHRLAM